MRNRQLGTQRVELDNEINNLQGQVDVLDGRVGANEDALGDLGQKNTDQDAQIEENTQKIDALARTAAGGVWRYMAYGDTTKTDDGEFTLWKNQFGQPCRNWDEVRGMTVASKDDGGTDHDISAWEEGDHIELFEEGGTGFAIFELAQNTQTSRPGQQELKPVLRSSGNPLDRIKYRFRIFDASTGIDFNEADERYVNATGDTMTGGLSFKRPKGSAVTTIYSKRPTGWDSDGKPQFGMVLDITDGNSYKHTFQIKARGYGSNATTTLYKGFVDNNSGPNNIFQGKLKGDELYEDGKRVSTQEYTDQKYDLAKSHADTGDRKIREDLEAEVQSLKKEIDDAKIDSALLNAPARLRWKKGVNVDPMKKQFTFDETQGWAKIHLESDNNVKLNRNIIGDTQDIAFGTPVTMITFWYYNTGDEAWEMMFSAPVDRVRWNQSDKNDLRVHFDMSKSCGDYNFKGNYTYYITIGGIF